MNHVVLTVITIPAGFTVDYIDSVVSQWQARLDSIPYSALTVIGTADAAADGVP